MDSAGAGGKMGGDGKRRGRRTKASNGLGRAARNAGLAGPPDGIGSPGGTGPGGAGPPPPGIMEMYPPDSPGFGHHPHQFPFDMRRAGGMEFPGANGGRLSPGLRPPPPGHDAGPPFGYPGAQEWSPEYAQCGYFQSKSWHWNFTY